MDRVLTSPRRSARSVQLLTALGLVLVAKVASAQLVQAEPSAPIVASFPPDAPPVETQVTLQVVIDATGVVESAVETSRVPRDAPDAFVRSATEAVKAARFVPSTRDGRPIRARIEYVVVFHPPEPAPVPVPVPAPSAALPAPAPAPAVVPVPVPSALPGPAPSIPIATPGPPPAGATSGDTVRVRGIAWASPRGLGDVRVDRETLTASPRQQTSEMLSAAPGFFVDHEDGEGLGNDVYLRGFDLDNGSGIEMKVGEVPINIPLHIHGQGYADVNFIIPEVVRSIRVLEGAYDPRQGGLGDRGAPSSTSGSANAATWPRPPTARSTRHGSSAWRRPRRRTTRPPRRSSLRSTQGFGQDRASKSASVNAQYGIDLTDSDHLRILATAYASSASAARCPSSERRERRNRQVLRRLPQLQRVLPGGLLLGLLRQTRAGRRRVAGDRERRAGSHDEQWGPLRHRAVVHVDELRLAPELHGRPQQLEPPASAGEPRRSVAAHQRRDGGGRHRPLPHGAGPHRQLHGGGDGAGCVAPRRPRPEQGPRQPRRTSRRGTTARAMASTRSTSPVTWTWTSGSGKSCVSRVALGPTSSTSRSTTTWPAWCLPFRWVPFRGRP